MSSVDDRKVAAVVGALVADAAAQPLHWNYKQEKLESLIEGLDEIAFRQESANPFYCIETGKQSCYGDQTYCILKSLVENSGLDIKALQNSTYEMFGPESEYENEVNKVYKSKTDKNPLLPIHSPWRHFSIKDFIRNYDKKLDVTGSETDEQIDCVLRAIPVTALFAGRSDMLDRVEDVIRITQNNDLCVAVGLAAARLLEHYILYGKDDNALNEVIRQLSDENRKNPQDLDKAMAGMLRQVLNKKSVDHYTAAKELCIS